MALNFLRPGVPAEQPVGDIHAARSAIFVGFINGLLSPDYLQPCLRDDVEQRCYRLASFVVAMLGVALLIVHMAFSATLVSSPVLHPVVKWAVWLAKVLTGGTLQFGLSVFHSCLRMLCARFMLVSA